MASNPPANLANLEVGKIIPYDERVARVKRVLHELKVPLSQALPSHVKVDRFVRICLSTVQKNPELLDCEPATFIAAVYQCAQLGLETDGVLGQAYLVPFKNKGVKEVQLIPGYRGLMKLAYQTGEVSSIRARVVRERDKFGYGFGLFERLEHEPHRGQDAGELVAVYAVARIKGVEDPLFIVLERWEIDKIRERSKASQNGPWVTDYDEMAKKSAIRRLCKMLPASVEKDNLGRAVALDERAEAGVPQQIEIIDAEEASPAPAAAAEAAAPAPSEPPAQATDPAEKPAAASGLDKLAEASRAKREGKAG